MPVDKLELYKKYVNVCLSQKDYKNLVSCGVIPKNLLSLYSGTVFLLYDFNMKNYSGTFIDDICTSGVKLFLNDWGDEDKLKSNHKAYFFFEDFLVITPEPGIRTGQHPFEKAQDILPVAIPLNKIDHFEAKQYVGDYQVSIYFKGDKVASCRLNPGMNVPGAQYPDARNFSYHVNNKLFNAGNSIKAVENKLSTLMRSCSRTFDIRNEIVLSLFSNPETIEYMQKYIYARERDFLLALIDKKDEIPKDCQEALSIFNRFQIKYESEKEKKLDVVSQIEENLRLEKENLGRAIFFQKWKFKSIIRDLEQQKLVAEQAYSSFDLPRNEYISLVNRLHFAIGTQKEGSHGLSLEDDKVKNSAERMKKVLQYEEAKEQAKIIGYDKYINNALENQEIAQGRAKASDILANLADIQSRTKAVKRDSAVLGGLASGLAGPVMGVATYAKTEIENARAEEHAAQMRKQGAESRAQANAFKASYSRESDKYAAQINQVTNRRCDTDDTDLYYSYLDCKVKDYVVSDDGIMTINVNVKMAKEPNIGGMPIIIDGSLIIEILHNGKRLGDAYLCAKGFNETNLNYVGFNTKRNYKVIGVPVVGNFKANESYTFTIYPYNIWMIEGEVR